MLLLCLAVGLAAQASKIKDAKVMICAIVKHEEQYIDEWLLYHKFLGFDWVHLYDNANEPSPYLANLHQVYGDFVRVIPFPGPNQQREAYLDCLYKFNSTNTWAAFIDADEFIVLRKHANIKSFLRSVAPKGGGVVLNWSLFSNNGAIKQEKGQVLSRFTYTTEKLNPHIKTIAYMKHVRIPDVHNSVLLPHKQTVDVQGRRQKDNVPFMPNNEGNKKIAYINHYHTKSLEEYILKKRRGRADIEDGGTPNLTQIAAAFEAHNQGLALVQDTFARDFYLKHYFGKEYETIFKKSEEAEKEKEQDSKWWQWWWSW